MVEMVKTRQHDDLALGLAKARREFHRGRRDGDGGRRGAGMALLLVCQYLRVARRDVRDDLLPLFRLAEHLGDLDGTGKVDAIFRPVPAEERGREKGGAPPMTSHEEQFREIVAVSVSILQDDDQSRTAAILHVRLRLEQIGRPETHGTVAKWQADVRANLPRGVGEPRKPDKDRIVPSGSEPGALYLHEWFCWRARGCDISTRQVVSGKRFVDHLFDDLPAFL
jgi:hypothetical protein